MSYTLGYNAASQLSSRTLSNDLYGWLGTALVSRTYSVNGLNQYSAVGSTSFTYDANGNLTGDGAKTYLYDIENRLVSTSGAVAASLRYDPLGRLYETVGGGVTTRFLYDGDELVGEYDASGALQRRYVHGAGVDDPIIWYEGASVATTALRRLRANWQGSIVAIANNAGAKIAINGYDEWGIPNTDTNGNAINSGRFQYTGQAWLPEVGLYYYKARLYSPTLGRFMQTDPIGYDDGLNWYAYVANDPVNRLDPSGTQTEEERRAEAEAEARSPAQLLNNSRGSRLVEEIREIDPFFRNERFTRAGDFTEREVENLAEGLRARRELGIGGKDPLFGGNGNGFHLQAILAQARYQGSSIRNGETFHYQSDGSATAALDGITGGRMTINPNGTIAGRADLGNGRTGVFNVHQGTGVGRTGWVLSGRITTEVTGTRFQRSTDFKIEFRER